jgi:hypothetical protein
MESVYHVQRSRILKGILSVGILNLPAVHERRKAHALWVMTLVGCLVLVPWFMMLWLAPATTSQPKSVKPIGTSVVSHGEDRPTVSRNLVWTVQFL